MHNTFQQMVFGVALTLMLGWILIIGRGIILPVTASVIVAYIVIGMSELILRTPVLGKLLPAPLWRALSMLVAVGTLVGMIWLIITNLTQIAGLVPQYQDQLLRLIQVGAVRIGLETEPTWQTLRTEVLGRVNVQRAIGLTLTSAASIAATFTVVMIYAGFLLIERESFANKIDRMSDDPERVTQIRTVIRAVNSRIGTYLAMKTMINIVLALVSYGIMRLWGIEFAGFWAILIGLANYIPYLGGFIGVTPTVLLAILQFGDFWTVSMFLLSMVAIQVLLGNFIEPWLMGTSLNLSPFVILVSLVAWTSMWGIAGAILSVPLMAMLVIIFSEFRGTRTLAILLSKNGEIAPAVDRSL